MSENAAVCVKCGVAKGVASNYCPNCGSETNEMAAVCTNCGVALKGKGATGTGVTGEKSKLVAGLLAIFLGHIGLHEFYLGEKQKGLYKIIASVISAVLVVFVGIGFIGFVAIWVWNIIDAVKIFQGKVTDADGNELS